MKKFEINENDVKAAFDAAKTDEMKNVLKYTQSSEESKSMKTQEKRD